MAKDEIITKELECFDFAVNELGKTSTLGESGPFTSRPFMNNGSKISDTAFISAIMSTCLSVGGVEDYKHGLSNAAQGKPRER